MELGGNAPFIVVEDADVEAAVEGAMLAKFRNGGQACTAANRFYVHESVAESFTTRLASQVEQLSVGPASGGAEIGPLISEKALRGVLGLVDRAVAEGARVVGRSRLDHTTGHFLAPMVLAGVRPDAEIVQSEIFGPVAPVVVWRDEEEMLAWVNASEHGLAAYVFAGDVGHALRIAERLEAGMVGVNRGLVSDPAAPFGGVRQSGLGREGADVGMDEYLETQYFSVDWS